MSSSHGHAPPSDPSSHPPSPLAHALAQNRAWATHTTNTHPTFFKTLSTGQHPPILWLGCSDSRVPETTITGLEPGQIFVHRNIANILPPTDLNSAAVIEYAVAHVGVQHVVVCGHTACGGCTAALGNERIGVIDAWLMPLRRLRAGMVAGWEGVAKEERVQRLVEANVKEGVRTLRENPNVVRAVRERGLMVHGLVYDIATGLLRELEVEDVEGEGVRREAFGVE
ncbi:hypothetical protein MMC26_003786 [Xylographa opegraphella]|nr:hypothetical protein [Xylographa opegraphella]